MSKINILEVLDRINRLTKPFRTGKKLTEKTLGTSISSLSMRELTSTDKVIRQLDALSQHLDRMLAPAFAKTKDDWWWELTAEGTDVVMTPDQLETVERRFREAGRDMQQLAEAIDAIAMAAQLYRIPNTIENKAIIVYAPSIFAIDQVHITRVVKRLRRTASKCRTAASHIEAGRRYTADVLTELDNNMPRTRR
jgi:hypothetical protein